MGVSAVKLTQLSPVSLQLLSVASLHLPAITANYVPLMIHHINRIESLKVSLDSLEWPAKRATNVSADTSNRCVHHRPRDIARNAALLSSTFRTAPLTITSRHEASITAKFLVEQLDLQFSLSRPIGTKSGGYLEERRRCNSLKKTGATRRIRTADLLITNAIHATTTKYNVIQFQ
jgi:hypothetical protein